MFLMGTVAYKDIVFEHIFDGAISLLSALIVALITSIVLNKIIIKQRKLGEKLIHSGVNKAILGSGGIKLKDWKELIKLTKDKKIIDVNLCFLTGRGFLVDQPDVIINLLKKGVQINIVLGDPNGQFLNDEYAKCKTLDELKQCHQEHIEELVDYYYEISQDPTKAKGYLERSFIMLENKKTFGKNESESKDAFRAKFSQHGEHIYQIYYVKHILKDYIKHAVKDNQIRLFYYQDQYRIPYVIINCEEKNKTDITEYTYAWCNIVPPAQEAFDAIRLYCSRSDEDAYNFVSALKESSDYILAISRRVDIE